MERKPLSTQQRLGSAGTSREGVWPTGDREAEASPWKILSTVLRFLSVRLAASSSWTASLLINPCVCLASPLCYSKHSENSHPRAVLLSSGKGLDRRAQPKPEISGRSLNSVRLRAHCSVLMFPTLRILNVVFPSGLL